MVLSRHFRWQQQQVAMFGLNITKCNLPLANEKSFTMKPSVLKLKPFLFLENIAILRQKDPVKNCLLLPITSAASNTFAICNYNCFKKNVLPATTFYWETISGFP